MSLKETSVAGTVLRIERSSIYDGNGFRTVIFLKGCPLRCLWCSTPESQAFEMEQAGDITYGRRMSVAEVMQEVRKDSACFFHSGGGMTLSGGEILAQPAFSRALLAQAQNECIDTAIETSLFAPFETCQKLLPYVNTIYADLKVFDSAGHRKYCGIDNRLILENFKKLNGPECDSFSFRLIARIPLIPGVNDSREELTRSGNFLATLKRLDHVELLPYHRLGTATYERLGRPYLMKEVKTPSADDMERAKQLLAQFVPAVVC